MSNLLSSSTPHHFIFFSKPYFQNPNKKLPLFKKSPIQKTLISNLQSISNSPQDPLPNSAIQRIADKLKSLGFQEPPNSNTHIPDFQNSPKNDQIGEIFVPNPNKIPNYRVGFSLDSSWSTPQNPVPDPGSGGVIVKLNGLSRVAKEERESEGKREKVKEKAPTLAELRLSRAEIRRLTTMGITMKQSMKLGKAGITEGVVNGIHERWRSFEVVKIVCEDICRLNMKRTHDLLERKTGGMVVWRTGSKIVLYRGVDYKYPYFSLDEASCNSNSENVAEVNDGTQFREENHASETLVKPVGQSSARVMGQSSLVSGVGSPSRVRFMMPGESELVEEADRLLDGLGPRFTDWWGCEPLPIDADLLPAVVPGYRRPFRLLPYGVRPQLTNDEMTILKRLGRPLPCHFALGRNRKLQGLAAAVLKLWEKCEIAKIAVKRGVQNTNSELMAEELKRLTGGILLSRDKEYMVFYRGKDFLPSAVSSAIEERRRNRTLRDEVGNDSSTIAENNVLHTEGHASGNVNKTNKDQRVRNDSKEHKIASIQKTIERTSRKLSVALEEKAKTEKLLLELEQAEISKQAEVDKEGITEEERYMLRKVGLKMNPFLLMGRRGVFDGTIENMHLHWKYRELVKIICGGSDINEIHKTARILEAESGGILVAVERVRKGHAIIVYRGKNYLRPASLRPETLLNKKEALKRSIESQRRESLKVNVLKLTKNIDKLEHKLVEDMEALDSKSSEQKKSKSEEELTEPNSIVFDNNEDSEDNILSLDGLVCQEANSYSVMKEQTSSEINHKASCTESILTSGPEDNVVNNEITEPSQKSVKKEVIPQSSLKAEEKNFHSLSTRARTLTNKERLLLRRLALKTKRRPVLAVGKSNVVTGFAKAIKDHFKKYPLAIVNVKGRAKGTSVQEVIFKLEQETGGVLVSQEPSKIILYRGWGAGLETNHASSKENHEQQTSGPSLAVSPELLEAMRVECGFPSN